MSLEEDHDFPDFPLGLPCFLDMLYPGGSDARDLPEPVWGVLNDVQGFILESVDQTACQDGTDPFDQIGAEVASDGVGSGWQRGSVMGHLKLESVPWVLEPAAFQVQLLTGLDTGEASNHSGQIVLARNPETANSVAGLVAAVDEPFDLSPQSFNVGRQR